MRLRLIPFVAAGLALASAGSAHAATADATITGGSLAFTSTPGNVSFPGVTLNGSNQTTSKTQAIGVTDARGNGAGWNVTATSTLFTNASSDTLPVGSATVASGPSVACDATVTCTTATNAIAYPYTLPSGVSAPTATKLYNAAANTGMGAQTFTPNWQLAVPASAKAGTYTSTWTISLVSGP